MSINVTVHGNPISIKRGKMVAIDADKEFELRRKIRLQQVRQQSKEIAEDVRNRVRKEKNKQLLKLDKNAQKDLKKIQERKLASLQKQYQECLQEFGAAYREAEKEPDPDEIIGKVSNINRHQAELRGKIATEQQKINKLKEIQKTNQHIENKKDVRNIENLRSKLVSSLHKNKSKPSPFKNKKKRKCFTDIRINGVATVLSDESEINSDLENLSVLDEISPDISPGNGSLDSQGNSIYSLENDSLKDSYTERSYEKENHRDNVANIWDKLDKKSDNYGTLKQKYDSRKEREHIHHVNNDIILDQGDNITRNRLELTKEKPGSLLEYKEPRKLNRILEMSPDERYDKNKFKTTLEANFGEFYTNNDKLEVNQRRRELYRSPDRHMKSPEDAKHIASHISRRIKKVLAGYDHVSNSPPDSPTMQYKNNTKYKMEHRSHQNKSPEVEKSRNAHREHKTNYLEIAWSPNYNTSKNRQCSPRNTSPDAERNSNSPHKHKTKLLDIPKSPNYDRRRYRSPDVRMFSDNYQKSRSVQTPRSLDYYHKHKSKQSEMPKSPGCNSPKKSPKQGRSAKDKPKTRLQSGLDTDGRNPFCACETACDETNCPVLLSEPRKPRRRSVKINKENKTPKKNRGATSPAVYRKVIMSEKAQGGDSLDVCEKINIHDYDNEMDSIQVSPRKCLWDRKGLYQDLIKGKNKRVCPRSEVPLPYVPTTTVLPETVDSQDSTVRYYDHFNRFSKQSNQPTVVQKISEESIQVCPPTNEDEEYRARMVCRDEEARIRGNKALEKSKIQRDYQQLLKELPLLQRQEYLAKIGTQNPALYMSDERYQEYERKKQNRMDNMFENMQMKGDNYDKPIITLNSIRKPPPDSEIKQPFKTLDVSEENDKPVLNVGQWEKVESVASITSQKTSGETPSEESIDKEQALAELLKRVNKQRDILLKEAANLPCLSNLKNVLSEDELLTLLGKKPQQTKVLIETGTSPLITKESQVKKIKKTKSVTSKGSSKRNMTSSSEGSVEIPQKPKKPKHKKIKVLIKEEATQTSPTVNKRTFQTFDIEKQKEEGTQTCPNASSNLCECPKHKCLPSQDTLDYTDIPSNGISNSSSDKVCEIIIKACDDSNVQVSQHTTPREQGRSKSGDQKLDLKPKQQSIVKIKIKDDKYTTREPMQMSTSTSYMSPPVDVPQKSTDRISSFPSKSLTGKSSNKELLHPQKQQTNIDHIDTSEPGTKKLNPRLVKYIERLLTMSRQSIDELTISSVSDISTPHDSVMNASSNIARDKLHSVMEHFNLSVEDLKNYYISTSSVSISDISTETPQNHRRPDGPEMQFLERICQYTDTSKDDKTMAKSVKKYASVSTSTDPVILQSEYQSVMSSGTTTTTDQNEKLVQEYKKKQELLRRQMRSPHSTQPSSLESHKERSPSVSIVEEKHIRSKSSSPRAQSPIVQKDIYQYIVDDPKRFTSVIQTEEQYTYPSTSTEYPKLQEKAEMDGSIKKSSPRKERSPKSRESTPKELSPKRSPQSPSPKQVTESTPVTRSPIKVQFTPSTHSSGPRSPVLEAVIPPTYNNIVQNPQDFLQFVRESLGMSPEEFTQLGFHDMFSRHMELTEYCHDRIRSLMDLIEKVRNDKQQLLTPSPVDQSMTLTSYLDLPQAKPIQDTSKEDANMKTKEDSGSSSSISQSVVDEYLLGLEENQIPEKIKQKQSMQTVPEKEVQDEASQTVRENSEHDNQEFVPMLQGIPKYTGQESTSRTQQAKYLKDIIQHLKAKPPPSLLRANMRGQTDAVPHELSTIVEAETMISSRNASVHIPQTPEKLKPACLLHPTQDCDCRNRQRSPSDVSEQKRDVKYLSPLISEHTDVTSDSGGYITISPEKSICIDKESKSSKVPKGSSPISSTSTSQNSVLKSSLSGVQPLTETSTDSPDELESMLRKFKLEWAISLVRKTEQALALSSSSSASDTKVLQSDNNSSEISIKENYKRIYQKLASSSGSDEKSNLYLDLSQHFREFHDVSGIPGVAEKANKSQQRTSTPVQHSKSTESQKSVTKDSMFKIDSELSSVRNSSEENLFLSIPNVTLNTTNCSLNKRKT